MRHSTRTVRLSRPTDHRTAMLKSLVKSLVTHGQIHTTFTRAKEAQRVADRLVTLGKEGSVHARRQAFRVLQDRDLVKQLFADIAPRFIDVRGGYTRVVRLGMRRGDGAPEALLAFTRLPAVEPPKEKPAKRQAVTAPAEAAEAKAGEGESEEEKKKGLLGGLRDLWSRKKKGS